jgi:hypothetical protein
LHHPAGTYSSPFPFEPTDFPAFFLPISLKKGTGGKEKNKQSF